MQTFLSNIISVTDKEFFLECGKVYMAFNTKETVFYLPEKSAENQSITIISLGIFSIKQRAKQYIMFVTLKRILHTSYGEKGYVRSIGCSQYITIECVLQDTIWSYLDSNGSFFIG